MSPWIWQWSMPVTSPGGSRAHSRSRLPATPTVVVLLLLSDAEVPRSLCQHGHACGGLRRRPRVPSVPMLLLLLLTRLQALSDSERALLAVVLGTGGGGRCSRRAVWSRGWGWGRSVVGSGQPVFVTSEIPKTNLCIRVKLSINNRMIVVWCNVNENRWAKEGRLSKQTS